MSEQRPWGPENPHPLSRLKTELVWEGKYDDYGHLREVVVPNFPSVMQRIETIDEPRDRSRAQGSLFDEVRAHRDDFRNSLIWGDNKLAANALMEEFRGKVSLIYIDPPFDVGADFTLDVAIGDGQEVALKDQSVLEAVAYRDAWGRGTDSFIHLMYERLTLMRDLLSPAGSIYVHCDWRLSGLLRLLLDELFGHFENQISWKRSALAAGVKKQWRNSQDHLLFYSRTGNQTFNPQFSEHSESSKNHYNKEDERGVFRTVPLMASGRRNGTSGMPWRGVDVASRGKSGMHWLKAPVVLEQLDGEGLIYWNSNGVPELKYYMDQSRGVYVSDFWDDISVINSMANEYQNYATQKPELLLDRIIRASSNEGDLVADLFCGSGTTLAVAEKLGRKWIGCDLGRFAIHTTRKRLIGVQRELNENRKPYRSFDVYNLGRYERQWWQLDRLKGANEEHRATVLKFFRAQALPTSPSPLLQGIKGGAFVHVDDIDSLLTYEELEQVARAVADVGGRSLVCLAWEFQMDLKVRAQALEAALGIDISLKYIPREIMEPNRTEVQFFEAAALDADAVVTINNNEKTVDVKLTRFIPSLSEVPEQELEELRARAIKSPFDFIDFWAIDFEHRDEKPFEHHWQDYRTRKDRKLLTQSNCGWKYERPGSKLIRIKVIDVFGIDTTKVIEVTV